MSSDADLAMITMSCVRKGIKYDFVRLLKKEGKNILKLKEVNCGQTPLHVASEEGFDDLVKVMLEDKYKVDVNAIDDNGWTPLHSASNGGKLAIVEMLLKKGAFARALTNEGSSALHYLVRNDYSNQLPKLFHVINLLLKKGSMIDLQNTHGHTPLHQSAMRGRVECLHFLLQNKANPNLQTKHKETALYFAIRGGHVECVDNLLQMGADPTIGTSKEIIYSTAKKLDNPMITNLLNQWYMQNDKEIPILMDETEDSKSNINTSQKKVLSPVPPERKKEDSPLTPVHENNPVNNTPVHNNNYTNLNPTNLNNHNNNYNNNSNNNNNNNNISVDEDTTSDSSSSRVDSSDHNQDKSLQELKDVWVCRSCKETFSHLPLTFFCQFPNEIEEIPEDQRENRTKISTDLCSIDHQRFFVRGILDIPLTLPNTDNEKGCLNLTWGVWVQLDTTDFHKLVESWALDEVFSFKGSLGNNLPLYSETKDVHCSLTTRSGGARPIVSIETSEHQLYKDQHSGMEFSRFESILDQIFQDHSPNP